MTKIANLDAVNQEIGALFHKIVNDPNKPTSVFCVRVDGEKVWKAMWRGRVAGGEWTQRGPAIAWVECCNRSGKFRS